MQKNIYQGLEGTFLVSGDEFLFIYLFIFYDISCLQWISTLCPSRVAGMMMLKYAFNS